jgi:hypothetical protein
MQDFLTVLIYACAAVAAVAFFIAVFLAFESVECSAEYRTASLRESALIAAIPALVIGGTVASMASAGVA